jgi:cytochrome c biogenesis protein CcmG, thiol:disulfide interchange protein DsbE
MTAETSKRTPRGALTRRELLFAGVGVLIGLAIIAGVWLVTASTAGEALPGVGETNRPAPDIAMPALDGGTVRLSDYRGQVVLVNFWGTWCEPCKEETPALEAAYQAHKDQGLVVLGVNLRRQESDEQAIRAFLDQYGVTYTTALDVDGEAARLFQISPIPTSYFIDPAGNIRYVRVGTLTQEEVAVLFDRLRQEASALR